MNLSFRALLGGSVGAVAVFSVIARADSDHAGAPAVDPHPIAVNVLVSHPKTADRFIFLTPTAAAPADIQGPEIVDGRGRPVWFYGLHQDNNLVFDAELAAGYNSYRAYRHEWVGEPDTRPTATAQRPNDGHSVVDAIWNGATEVGVWDVVEAPGDEGSDDEGRLVASAPWNGLRTTIPIDEFLKAVVVVARNRAGDEIGRSAVTPVHPWEARR